MQELSNANSHFPSRFTQALTDPSQLGSGHYALDGGGRKRRVTLDNDGLHYVLVAAPSEAVRRQAYVVGYGGPAANVALLREMISCRREMAGLLGYDSYGHYRVSKGARPGRRLAE